MYLNQATIIGNLTKKPELRTTTNGKSVCSFSLATNKVYKDANGNKQESVEYHNCVAWGRTAEVIVEYADKGQKLMVQGRLSTRSWEKDGVKRYSTEIVVEQMQLGNKPGGSKKQDDGSQPAPPSDEPDINVDEVPF